MYRIQVDEGRTRMVVLSFGCRVVVSCGVRGVTGPEAGTGVEGQVEDEGRTRMVVSPFGCGVVVPCGVEGAEGAEENV